MESDAVVTAVNGLNGLLSIANSLTDVLGSLNTFSVIGGGIVGAKGLG